MRRFALLALTGLFLVNCNCEKGSSQAQKEAAKKLDLLELLPPKDLGFLVHSPELGSALSGLGLHLGKILDTLGSREQSYAQLKQRLGFDPFVAADLAKAGIDPQLGMVIWGGGVGAASEWKPHVIFGVTDGKALIATVEALAKKEAALQVEPVQNTPEGQWHGLFRTFGKKKEPEGGLLLRKDLPLAVLTGASLAEVQAFLKTKGSINDHPEWIRFRKTDSSSGHASVFFTSHGVKQAMAQQMGAAGLKVMPYLIKMGFETKKLWLSNHQIMDQQSLDMTTRLQPKPIPVEGPPKGSILAAAGSVDMNMALATLSRNPLVAAWLRRLRDGSSEADRDMANKMIAALGTTYRVYLGLNGEPSASPFVTLGQSFFGLDIIGTDPSALKELLPTVAEMAGLEKGLLAKTDKGYSIETPLARPLSINMDVKGKRLGLRFGSVGKELAELKGDQQKLKLPEGTLSVFYLDLKRLASTLGVASAAVKPEVQSVMNKAASVLKTWSHLMVDQRLDKSHHVQTLQVVLP